MRLLFLPLLLILFFSCGQENTKNSSIKGFIQIPSGYYILGDSSSVINPIHQSKTTGFLISETEITNAKFNQFITETNYVTTAEKHKNAMVFYCNAGLEEFEWREDSTANWRFPNGISNGGIEQKMNHPVTCISYYDILKYCEWAGVRLPTLDEWEIACRAGTTTPYFFDNQKQHIGEYGNIWLSPKHDSLKVQDPFPFTSPVKSFKPNPWGLYDVYGNCFEFCSDKFERIKHVKNVACARGGSWWCSKNSCNYFNSVDIGRVDKTASFSNHGFRVVMLEPEN